jgi:hypothetical protein
MIKYILCLSFFIPLIFSSCSSNNPVTPPVSSNYNKVYSAETGNTKFELYSATSNSLVSGYNDIGFKVYIDAQEMNSGYVKFYPKMYHHFIGSPTHSTPMSPKFYYNSEKNLFLGYAAFIMWTDTSTDWFGWYSYNDLNRVDSVVFSVQQSPLAQMKSFVDNTTETEILMTLVTPFNPKQGLNDFQLLCHRTINSIDYWEADSLEMYIKPWMQLMGHSSPDNVNPVWLGGGMYKGKINLNMSGEWYIYDSVKYNGTFITPTPPPKFIMECP